MHSEIHLITQVLTDNYLISQIFNTKSERQRNFLNRTICKASSYFARNTSHRPWPDAVVKKESRSSFRIVHTNIPR